MGRPIRVRFGFCPKSTVHRRTLLISAIFGLLAACGRRKKLKALPPGSVVLAFGDSVTHGTGAAPGEDWPSRLAALTGWNIVNAGVPGDTAEAGKVRLAPLLEEHRPALVIVEIGGNDFLRRRAASLVLEDIRQIVRKAKASGAPVVLVAVPELSLLAALAQKPSDSPIYRQLGEEEGVPVIASVFSDILSHAEWRADQIHPNAEGYRRMAAGIEAALKEIGLR